MANKPFLDNNQIDNLLEICAGWFDKSENPQAGEICGEFLLDVDDIARNLSHWLHDPKPTNKIPFLHEHRRKQPSYVKEEITRTIKLLENMSLEVWGHIDENKRQGTLRLEYRDWLQALKQPYKPDRGRNPDRDAFIEDMRHMVNAYKIHPSSYDSGKLVLIITIICEAANAKYDPQEIAKKVIKT